MKICSNCKAILSDDRNRCIDCGSTLGEPVGKEKEREIRSQLSEKSDKLLKRTDDLSPTLSEIIVGALSLIGFCATLVVLLALDLQAGSQSYAVAIAFFVACAVNALLPKLMWTLERLRLYFLISNADEAEPSFFYLFMRKISIYISFAVAVVSFISIFTGQ